MELWWLVLLTLTGIVSGFYSGLVGSGGNVILIPILDIVLYQAGLRQGLLVKSIIAHSLILSFFLGIIVSYRQYKAGNFFIRDVLLTSTPGMFTALFTTWLITYGSWYNKKDFDLVFATMLFLLILKLVVDNKSGLTGDFERNSDKSIMGIGAITGVVTSLSGLGGGIILIPGFTDLMKMSLKKASSISISVIAMLALPVSISYLLVPVSSTIELPLQVGLVSFAVVFPIMAGVLISAPFGVKAAHRLNPRVIKFIFSIIVCSLLVKMIYSMG